MTATRLAARKAAASLMRGTGKVGGSHTSLPGSDFRSGVVASVGGSGTVTMTDGIVARRLQTYRAPAVGDQCIISRSGSGNWLAHGRLATTNDGWTTMGLSNSWTSWGSPYYTPGYRLNSDGTASLRGLAKAPASTTGASTLCTLPAALAPAAKVRFVTEVATNIYAVLDILASGAVQINDYTGTATWASLDVARNYSLT